MKNFAPRPEDRFPLLVRWLLFLLGVAVMSLGIALTIHADLGTTPISTPPAALAAWNLTVGQWTIIFNAMLVVIQIVLLRRRFTFMGYLQFGVAVVFGLLCDLSLRMTDFLAPEAYWQKWALALIGSLVVAVGVFIEVLPGLLYVPGEGVVSAIVTVTGWNFGTVKQCFDWSLVILAVVLSLILNGHIVGVREGTVFAAFAVGAIVRVLQRLDAERLRKKHFGY
ncbi:YczE/YyaS/YitT family protein [Corynebacterium frankenforstense]